MIKNIHKAPIKWNYLLEIWSGDHETAIIMIQNFKGRTFADVIEKIYTSIISLD